MKWKKRWNLWVVERFEATSNPIRLRLFRFIANEKSSSKALISSKTKSEVRDWKQPKRRTEASCFLHDRAGVAHEHAVYDSQDERAESRWLNLLANARESLSTKRLANSAVLASCLFLFWLPFLRSSHAVYDATVGDSISRSLKRYGLILLFRLIIVSFVVQSCGIDNIKRFLASLGLPFCVYPQTRTRSVLVNPRQISRRFATMFRVASFRSDCSARITLRILGMFCLLSYLSHGAVLFAHWFAAQFNDEKSRAFARCFSNIRAPKNLTHLVSELPIAKMPLPKIDNNDFTKNRRGDNSEKNRYWLGTCLQWICCFRP